MTNALQWADQVRAGDVVRAPFADVRIAVIDPVDIGAVGAAALLDGGYEGRTLRLSGPEALTPGDRVRILGEVLRRDLRFEPQTDEQAHAEMSAAMPAPYVEAFFSFYAEGKLDESVVTPAVADVTGRPPRTFAEWAAEHAGAFR
jgi:uncharacterized protein YbjT (DUF2867 family)